MVVVGGVVVVEAVVGEKVVVVGVVVGGVFLRLMTNKSKLLKYRPDFRNARKKRKNRMRQEKNDNIHCAGFVAVKTGQRRKD